MTAEATATVKSRRLTLRRPVEFGDVELTELQLAEPTCQMVFEACAAGPGPIHRAMHLLKASVPAHQAAAVDAMRQRDVQEAWEFFEPFCRPIEVVMPLVADLTWFFHWGPKEALALTWSELLVWHAQAVRIQKEAR